MEVQLRWYLGQLRWYLADVYELFKDNSSTTTVTQSKLLTSAGPTTEVNIVPVRQLSQMGITANERESGFGFFFFIVLWFAMST